MAHVSARQCFASLALVLLLGALLPGCRAQSGDTTPPAPVAMTPIADVIARHSAELMAIPGVVGLYQGETRRHTPCVRIMVARRTQELVARLPKSLDGHVVEVEETGEIKPLTN